MRILFAIVCLSLLMVVDPASAQRTTTYSLTISHHRELKLSAPLVDEILVEASNVLKTCNVSFRRKGEVGVFADAPLRIESPDDRDDVHKEPFDVKVVEFIGFCRIETGHRGCAWDPPSGEKEPRKRSMIIKRDVFNREDAKLGGIIFAHEFGHRTGLWHRNVKNALMSPCTLEHDDVQVTDKECACFRGGPGFCKDDPEPKPKKPDAVSSFCAGDH
jgi:hypothetical protein